MLILGIETSCDETAVAIVNSATSTIVAQHIYSQIAEHERYRGVVPELAARAHLERLPELVSRTLASASLKAEAIDAIAATVGPGLTTALVIGSTFAQSLAVALNKPFLAVNHIEGHALSPLLANPPAQLPYLLLLVTGGHTQLVMVHAVGNYELLGTTQDDAVGECFDKVGKLLGLPHPAGPLVEKRAAEGQPHSVSLPQPLTTNPLDFSFSGLKTAVKDLLLGATPPSPANMAASFQQSVAQLLARKLTLALRHTGATQAVVAGGVAANATIRAALQQACSQANATFTAPPLSLCTDNAAMIALTAGLRHQHGLPQGGLGTPVVPRWPLNQSHPNVTLAAASSTSAL